VVVLDTCRIVSVSEEKSDIEGKTCAATNWFPSSVNTENVPTEMRVDVEAL
jgi:hypothetical protein